MALEKFELCFQPGVFVAVNTTGVSPTPTTGETYSITLSGTTYCATLVGGLPSGPPYTLGTLFDSCFECNKTIPLSANTDDLLCIYDCSGNTLTFDLPKPVWTNNNGNEVTQLNAVQLGGPNGLNS